MGRKTYKREVAGALLLFACGLAAYAAREDALAVLEIVFGWIVMFAAAAFGLDVATKTILTKKDDK